MKRFIYSVVILVIIVLGFSSKSLSLVIAQEPSPTEAPFAIPTLGDRFAACDLCGYCPPNPPPSSWVNCQKCLYPSISSDPALQESLKIDPDTNIPITPALGRQYTFLGCITTGAGGFTEEGGAGSVVQTLLKTVFSLVGAVAFIYFLYGSFILATSQNDPEKLNYGKRTVYGALAGLVFSLTSVLLVNFIASQVLKIPGFN